MRPEFRGAVQGKSTALELDDPKYVESWQGEHFPRLASGELKLNGEVRGNSELGEVAKGKSADTWAP